MRTFFLDRVGEESVLSGQAFLYLHYADMIANGYSGRCRARSGRRGCCSTPTATYTTENFESIGNVLTTSAEELYFKAENLAHRDHVTETVCPTCLSPCQVNVGAMKQFVPYAKFLVRAYQVKHDPARHLKTLPMPQP